MNKIFQKCCIVLFFMLSFSYSNGQSNRYNEIEQKLKELSKKNIGLNEKIELNAKNISIQDLAQAISSSNNLNISVDPTINIKVANNFSNVSAIEVLSFICNKYDLDIEVFGSIINIKPYSKEAKIEPKPTHNININYDKTNGLIDLELNNDTLSRICKLLTQNTKYNIVYSPELSQKTISGYYQKLPINKVLESIAFSNDLKVTLTDDSIFIIDKKEKDPQIQRAGNIASPKFPDKSRTKNTNSNLNIISDSLISLEALNQPITDILSLVCSALKIEFYLYNEIKGNTTLKIEKSTFQDFLKMLFNGTDYTYKSNDKVFLFGEKKTEGLRYTETYKFRFRSSDKIIEIIPQELKKDIELKLFPDQNSIIMFGNQISIGDLKKFLVEIDKVVPVVLIEVMIMDIRNTRTINGGIKGGLGKSPTTTSGSMNPGFEANLGANSINDLLLGLTGFGIINLGRVTPNFYLNIKALEDRGFLKLRSTPKLATLNGHEAKLSIGKTEYYLEISNNVIGTQNPQNIITQNYKSVNADLSVTISPMVSADNQITLDIKVKQSSFTERISANAPPGTITRDFQSMIRVKNEEMVVLGGLEENSKNDSGSGLPFFSRIPVLKWFFGTNTKVKSDNKLSIIIKPTVIY